MSKLYIVVDREGGVHIYSSLEEALHNTPTGLVVIEVEGSARIIPARPAKTVSPIEGERHTKEEGGGVHLVFDQMYKGFAEVIARELPGVELHEIMGVGLKGPVKRGRITRWPAKDDYDVMKIVEDLARSGGKVYFFTGDKRLARQVEALGEENIKVIYMPTGEYPGKEALIKEMLKAVKEETR
ncbi:MAG: hypothetical protein F7C35_08790 [Desulfurococcales archaeon]|nr:hypothetical protein [Desulfurococcales archaeon]